MAPLTERQKTAQALARGINAMGAWVTSPLPLDDKARLRFQIIDSDRDRVIEKLSNWDWSPAFVDILPRITPQGMQAATLYEINLPPDTPVVVDRIIRGELAERKKTSAEVEAVRRYLGWSK